MSCCNFFHNLIEYQSSIQSLIMFVALCFTGWQTWDLHNKSKEETRALGIEIGDIVCFEPRTRVTESGYIKSRFLDDKLSVGILLGLAKYISDNKIALPRRV